MLDLKLSRSTGEASNTRLNSWNPDNQNLVKTFEKPQIGVKDGSYFIRCGGTIRNNENTKNKAYLLILDGDSRIDPDTGEVLPGAPDPQLVHEFLTKLGVNHLIYSSYSNGEHGQDYFKYRVLILCEYSREQLPILLDHFFELLHEAGIWLFNVKENRTWCQPWYFPRVPVERAHLYKFFSFLDGGSIDSTAICAEYDAAHPRADEPPAKTHEASVKSNYSGLCVDPILLFNEYWKSPVNYLLSKGYRFKGKKLLHPNSSSGMAGVQVCRNCNDGTERIYSHNGSDPLSDGFSHDSFDCFKIIEHNGDETAALKTIGATFKINGKSLETYNRQQYQIQKSGTKQPTASFASLGAA